MLLRMRSLNSKRLAAVVLVVIIFTFVRLYDPQPPVTISVSSGVVSREYMAGLLNASPISSYEYVKRRLGEAAEMESKRRNSMFPRLFSRKKTFSEREAQILLNWSTSSRKEQCQILLKGQYLKPNWSNLDLFTAHEDEFIDDINMQLGAERIRLFKYCFIDGDLDAIDVFEGNNYYTNAFDYQYRMFPFLKKIFPTYAKYLYPVIKDVKTGKLITQPTTSLSVSEYNANFLTNWIKEAQGKGIVLTVSQSDVPLLRQQLAIWQELGNKYPIQIVHKGTELNEDHVAMIKHFAEKTDQDVSIVNLQPILDDEYAEKYIRNFHNKWFAAMFNSFEEVLLIDADAIPYYPVEEFFSLPGYSTTGFQMWRDREIIGEYSPKFCAEMMPYFEPTVEEHATIGSQLVFKLKDPNLKNPVTSEARALSEFYLKSVLHHVDSGLVVLNKKTKFHSLIMSELLHQDTKFSRCTYGDKELFWIGAFTAGEDFSIDSHNGGIIGPIGKSDHNGKSYICATQIGHTDSQNRLLWNNGGLRTCKFDDAAGKDWKKEEEYFKHRYETLDKLKNVYSSRLQIDGYIIPDTEKNQWIQIGECKGYMYCAFIAESNADSELDTGTIVRFGDTERDRINKISELWNEAKVN
ncbi:hypothetical protein RNJ44_00392 [Nakaseomyces bracarensis]|uniref:Alpha-1,3-mannosyltransferase n=1 Tax=Nakaseomyces bracarensis TaxID=273131 RepID=A0ABR4NSG3_9SACH